VTASRVFLGLRPSPFSLSRLLGSSRLSAGSVRKAPRTPLLSLASSSEYDRRRLPNLQAGPASSPRVSSPPAHAGTRGPPARGSQPPICSPLSVSHALRGLLPLEPSWAYPIPLALLGFHSEIPRGRGPLTGKTRAATATLEAESPKAPDPSPHGEIGSEEPACPALAAPGSDHTSRSAPPVRPSSLTGRQNLVASPTRPLTQAVLSSRRTGDPAAYAGETQAHPRKAQSGSRSGA